MGGGRGLGPQCLNDVREGVRPNAPPTPEHGEVPRPGLHPLIFYAWFTHLASSRESLPLDVVPEGSEGLPDMVDLGPRYKTVDTAWRSVETYCHR
ncbi:unnamed protein product [Arctogadus glacialis]